METGIKSTDMYRYIELLETGKKFMKMMNKYRCAIMEVETKLKVLNAEFSLQYDRNPFESIESRLKSPESIMEKLVRRGYELHEEDLERTIEENLYDVAGIRVVCAFQEDIYHLSDLLIEQDDIQLIRTKDYIKNPKPSGYRSLHLIVEIPIFLSNEKRFMRVEVQLRTIAMDFWASLEHKVRYKKDIPQDQAQEIARQLQECAETVAQTDQRMLEIRRQIENTRTGGWE